MRMFRYLLVAALGLSLFGCDTSETVPPIFIPDTTQSPPRAVYTLTNSPGGNQIAVFTRMADGSLSVFGQFATGGTGDGGNLNGSSNALIFQPALNRFYAVNAGDNTISMLQLAADGSIAVLDNVNSGGVQPISVTVFDRTVYVLNAGNAQTPANIVGFRINGNQLDVIPNSQQPLSAALPNPAQIEFNPTGTVLIVTERATNVISTYTVNQNSGVATGPNVNPSLGNTPFGFDFTPGGVLVVSEAQNGAVDAGTTSSYNVDPNTGALTPISATVPNNETAPCWVAITKAGNFAYVTNTGSDSVSGYGINNNGALTLLTPNGQTGLTGDAPVDVAITPEDEYLYTLNRADSSFSIFQIGANGGLTGQGVFGNAPATAVGLVAR